MVSNGTKCSAIDVNEMLESIQQKAKEESIPMNTYLTAELNIPEDEAPLLRKALSYLDTLPKNAPVAVVANNNPTAPAVNNPPAPVVNNPTAPAVNNPPTTVGGRRSRRNRRNKNKSRRGRR
jgi:hypothetical protein